MNPPPEVSVIVPARNEQACLAACLRSLVGQRGVAYEVIVVDDHSTDATRAIAQDFPVRVIAADPLPEGWSGKCNAAWTGARAATGKWLLFTDADTTHAAGSIAAGMHEAQEHDAGLLSYSPKQEVRSLAERALMPVIFAELAATYRPRDVCDPASPVAAANGQYLLIKRDVYGAIGGHAAVAPEILEDVALARRTKQAGYKLRFRQSDVVSTRMYRSFPQMWEGWTKNLALLFPDPRTLALTRFVEFVLIATWPALIGLAWLGVPRLGSAVGAVCAAIFLLPFVKRIRRAHFDRLSSALAIFGLPLFAALLVNSARAHRRGAVRWKGRRYQADSRRSDVGPVTTSVGVDDSRVLDSKRRGSLWRAFQFDVLTGLATSVVVILLSPLFRLSPLFQPAWVFLLTTAFGAGMLRASSRGSAWLKAGLLVAPLNLAILVVRWHETNGFGLTVELVFTALMILSAVVGTCIKRRLNKLKPRFLRTR